MPEDDDAPISFRDADLRGWLVVMQQLDFSGSSVGQIARQELSMWRTVQEMALRRHLLPVGWACLLADVFNGTIATPGLGALISHELHDAFRPDVLGRSDHYGDKHGVDEVAVAAWARDLDPVSDLAFRRAFAAWWALPNSEPTVAGFAAVGIRCVAD
jgi:hypothetical protein